MWNFGIIDAIDIIIVASLLYYFYRVSKKSGSFLIFQGIIIIFVVWILVSQVIKMRLLGAILDGFINVGLIAIIVIFQSEIRQMLIRFGSRYKLQSFTKIFSKGQNTSVEEFKWVDDLVHACRNMSENKVGALIVIKGTDDLTVYCSQGEVIDAKLSTRLIEQIFYKNTPLHDGAMIIDGDRIMVAGCVLPVSHNTNLPKDMGLRHRSAMGLTELTDAKVIVVSEETGGISIFSRSRYNRDLTTTQLQNKILGPNQRDVRMRTNNTK